MRALLLLAVALLGARATAADDVTVATHYFYWYLWPSEHFGEPGAPGPEGHARHFAEPERVSYLSADWHAQNFAQMHAAGIDVALPVYWGVPDACDRRGPSFSKRGLPAMVAALDRLAETGEGVKLGLFYDTSTLANRVRGVEPREGRADLTSDAGRALFCDTVTEFFAAIPPRHWARHRGGALVVLYVSGFAERWDATLGASLRAAFAQRFDGERVCLVADASWGAIGQDLTTSWGAALWGPQLFDGVAQLGAGYDDRAVPGRRTPLREREDGAFYAWSWQRAIATRPELVLLETWNEMHEGTELCPTREAGRQYLELTRTWIAKLRAPDADLGAPIELRWPAPRPLPDLSWGAEAVGADALRADFAASPPERCGLREVACEDGPLRVADGALRAGEVAEGLGNYLYLQVSDHVAFDVDADWELEVTRADDARLWVEYDSREEAATLAGAYTACRPTRSHREGDRLVELYRLDRARFANRQNGGADLRFVLPERRAALTRVVLRRR
ncbi:MAG: hypothetical protein H6828_07395 [Planctomycetes bacterium]|nr:hypothetical protein [Planctomycetota bacterium]